MMALISDRFIWFGGNPTEHDRAIASVVVTARAFDQHCYNGAFKLVWELF
jgi:hypothetical protein